MRCSRVRSRSIGHADQTLPLPNLPQGACRIIRNGRQAGSAFDRPGLEMHGGGAGDSKGMEGHPSDVRSIQ